MDETLQTQYTITFRNNSTTDGSACLFQRPSELGQGFPIAWFVTPLPPGNQVPFSWATDYRFVCGQTGKLSPGMIFTMTEMIPADPKAVNTVTLTSSIYGGVVFKDPHPGPIVGGLAIAVDSSIPENQVSAGIGMSGFPTFGLQVQPNMTFIFSTKAEYWVAFGSFTCGQVLDVSTLQGAAKITFPAGIKKMAAIWNATNSWTILAE